MHDNFRFFNTFLWNYLFTLCIVGEKGEPYAYEQLKQYKGIEGPAGPAGEPGIPGRPGREGKY